MQKFLNKIICGDCIEVLGGVDEPFADKTLLKYFANQFAVRTDNGKQYSPQEMATALEGLSG